MAYGDAASAYGRGEANGGGWGPSRGTAVGNSGGANYVYRSIPGGTPGSMGNWNTGGNVVGYGSMGAGIRGLSPPRRAMGGGGLDGGIPRPTYAPPPAIPTIPFGPPALLPETPAPEAPVTPSWGYSYGEDYTNPPMYSPGVNPYKTDFGGGNPAQVSNPRSRGW